MNNRALNTSYSGSMYNQDMKPLDYLYGPWESIDQMLNELNVIVDDIEPGLTVGVIENDKVVEYWNPISKMGFIKKTTGGSVHDKVDTYSEALELATVDNVGNFIFVKNEEVIEGVSYGGGLYLVDDENKLEHVSTNLWFGIFPEEEQMEEDEILHVNHDGAARLSEVYRIFKIEQLKNRKNLEHLNKHVEWMVEDLDAEDFNVDNTFVSKVEKKLITDPLHSDRTCTKIQIHHKDLDTENIIMEGGKDVNPDDTFIKVVGTNVGNYKNGDIIKNSDSLKDVINNLLITESHPTKFELPSLELNGIEDKKIYEVGSRLVTLLNVTYTDGKIQTFDGAENEDEGVMVDANCVSKRPVYTSNYNYVSTASLDIDEESFNQIPGELDILLNEENTYYFKASVDYDENLIIPKTNFGNIETDLRIPAGTVTDIKSIDVKFKFKASKIKDNGDNIITVGNDVISTENYGESRWLTKNEVFEDVVELKQGETYYVLCPQDCYVLYDTPAAVNVKPVKGGVYVHTLPNGDNMNYELYYMKNPGTYQNIRIMLDAE